jgi:acetyl esterase/lipase
VHTRWLAWTVLWLTVAIVATACSPSRLVSQLSPSSHLELERDIPYGGHVRQRLDVYRPHEASPGEAAPVVVFFYGGAWQRGERGKYGFVGSFLADQQVVAVVPDYRVYPEVLFPDFVEDGAAVLAWVQREIHRFGGDPARIVLMGHSAGAHIAALLALDHRYLEAAGVSETAVQGLIGLSGPYRFDIDNGTLAKIFAPDGGSGDSQPGNFAGLDAPAVLLLHGESDRVVEAGNSIELHASLCAAGADSRIGVYPGVGHVRIAAALAPPLAFAAPSGEDVAAFLGRWTGRVQGSSEAWEARVHGCDRGPIPAQLR